MKKVLIAVVAALVLAAGASASGGVSIEQGNDWNVFSPNPINPGDTTSVTVTTLQSGEAGSRATVTFTGLKAPGLTLVGNADASASCAMQNKNKAVCSYTDYAHSAKSDGYTFQLADDAAPGTYAVRVHVVVQGKGQAKEDLSITTPVPPVITPETFQQVDRVGACASAPILRADGSYGIFADLDEATFDSGIFQGVTFTMADYVDGVGLTCDVPAGYSATGSLWGDLYPEYAPAK